MSKNNWLWFSWTKNNGKKLPGTDNYFPPEMCKDKLLQEQEKKENKKKQKIQKQEEIKEYNGLQADVFSLGVTLIEITLGLYCFQKAYSNDEHYN